MPTVEGLPARATALRILDRVLRGGQTIDSAAQGGKPLPPADAALALAIAGETLRRLPELDALIDSATRQRLPEDSKARMVLRLALAQKAALHIPDHALVATALPLVDGGPRRLVHGVLGTLLRRVLAFSDETPLPAAVEARWREAWGEEVVAAARRAIVRRPSLDLSFRDEVASADFPLGVSLAPLQRRLAPDDGAVTSLPGFDAGSWWVQDLAASLPARLVPSAARTVVDACAAPGGKTMQLAAAGHSVTALDKSQSRLARLADNLARTGLKATTVAADALDWSPPAPVDAVLLDAPCSSTGTFRRHPEVLHRASPRIVADGADLQRRLLDRAARWVRPGGSLVYAVCSLEPAEGEARVERFLADHADWRLEPARVAVPGIAPHTRGWLRILPGMLEEAGGLDGFFIADLVRAPE
jgi:16S rRNA (cytosine967-C5)-methyltransferase